MLKRMPTAWEADPGLAFLHSEISEMHRYWQGLRGQWPIPCRADIDPVTAPRSLLQYMALAEVIDDEHPVSPPRRYRWRLVGTHITKALDRDLTGAFIDETYSAAVKRVLSDTLDWVIEKQKPLRLTGTADFAGKDWLGFESVYLPLRHPCGAVKTVLLGTIFS